MMLLRALLASLLLARVLATALPSHTTADRPAEADHDLYSTDEDTPGQVIFAQQEQWPVASPDASEVGHPPHPPTHLPKPPGPPKHFPGPPGKHPKPPPKHPHPRPPHFPHRRPQHSNNTVYDFLSSDPKFSQLVKFISLNNETVDLLNSSSTNITFFAAPNWALPKPRHPPPKPEDIEDLDEEDAEEVSFLRSELVDDGAISGLFSDEQLDEEDDKKKAIFKKIVAAVLAYHTVPTFLPGRKLFTNTTYATNLTLPDGSLGGEALRLKVAGGFPFKPTVNMFSKIVRPIFTANGVIYVINHPLLPPPSIFQELFGAPAIFATTTSALQRVELTEALEWRYVHGEDGGLKGSPATTFFAPSNRAFAVLPYKLRGFLFSPFGQKALKKLLQYHIVPSFVLHSDYTFNATSELRETAISPELPERVISSAYEDVEFMPDFELEEHMDGESVEPTDDDRHHRHRKGRGKGKGKGKGRWWKPSRGRRPPHHGCPGSPPPPRTSGWFSWLVSKRPSLPGKGRHHCPPPHHHPGPPHRPPGSPPPPISVANFTLPTLLTNHTLVVNVTAFGGGRRTGLFVNGAPIRFADGPARNGAVHVVDRLLHPFKHHHPPPPPPPRTEAANDAPESSVEEDLWDDWEEWLPQWAAE